VKAKSFERVLIAAALTLVCILEAACGSKIEGTYTNPSGVLTLDLRSGGKAQVTLYNESRDCTWKSDAKNVVVVCGGDSLRFGIHDDGSLSGPFTMGILRKSK